MRVYDKMIRLFLLSKIQLPVSTDETTSLSERPLCFRQDKFSSGNYIQLPERDYFFQKDNSASGKTNSLPGTDYIQLPESQLLYRQNHTAAGKITSPSEKNLKRVKVRDGICVSSSFYFVFYPILAPYQISSKSEEKHTN